MTGSSLKYLIKEGFRNTWTNRMMSIASICVLMSCLVLIGSASMIFLNIDALITSIEEENVIMVYAEDGTTQEQLTAMRVELERTDNVKTVEFVSKEVAWQEQLETMGEAEAAFFTERSNDIPLPDAFKVTVDNLDGFNKTVDSIKTIDNIDIVRENRDLAKKLVTIRQGISVIAIAIVAVLFIISMFIISNTIKLTVYSRRLEISIMKSVGATNSFVQLPFVVEGMLLGIASGAIGLGLVWGVYELAITQFEDLFQSLKLTPLSFMDYALPMLGIFIAIGIVSGVGGSLITMRKYLNKEGSEISAV